MEKVKVTQFVDRYGDTVFKMDIESITSYFHDQFVLSTQNNYWYISNNDEFKLNLIKSFEGYKKLGASFCKLIKFSIIDFQSNHCLVNIEWGLFDTVSNLLIKFDISYCIKEINRNLKYVFVIAHNEIERIEVYLKDR